MLESQGLDLDGLEIADGKTFRWEGSYHGDMGIAQTHDTQLNVFADFDPKVPSQSTSPKILFCAKLCAYAPNESFEQGKENSDYQC